MAHRNTISHGKQETIQKGHGCANAASANMHWEFLHFKHMHHFIESF